MISELQQFIHHADGTITVEGFPGLKVHTIEEQGRVVARDIERELGLPKYFEDWEIMAKPEGLSQRMVRFILMDQSVTRLQGNPRLQPRKVDLPSTCHLEFAHRGFVIGIVYAFVFGFSEHLGVLEQMGMEIPTDVEGDCLLAQARLFNSPLADKAWEALERGIFSHVCPSIYYEDGGSVETGKLVEVSLTTDDYPGIPNARVLNTWEETL